MKAPEIDDISAELLKSGEGVLRNIVDAPWFIRNNDLHRDRRVDFASSEIQRFAKSMRKDFIAMITSKQLDNDDLVRGLKRKKPYDLM